MTRDKSEINDFQSPHIDPLSWIFEETDIDWMFDKNE